MKDNLFHLRPNVDPRIYAYEDSRYKGCLKIGYTTIDVKRRVAQQYPVRCPAISYRIVLDESAMRDDGSSFKDQAVHKFLKDKGHHNCGEWFKCSVEDVKSAIISIRKGVRNIENRHNDFSMRPEQKEAVEKTVEYYKNYKKDNPGKIPRFLWNAKMRFGKTFAAYQLAKKMNFTKVLVLTFRLEVQAAWEDDLKTHIDFEGWQFISKGGLTYEKIDKTRPFVCFASFQDYLGKGHSGGIKLKNKWAHKIEWDLVILDEYHYGAWRDRAQDLFESEDLEEQRFFQGEGMELFKNGFEEDLLPIVTSHYLYLSGTPFRAITSGEFIEEQIYNWTYLDEQKAKNEWCGENNPYFALPRMILMTYHLPEITTKDASEEESDQFDLNEFFSAEGTGEDAKFRHENDVQKWLYIIRGLHPIKALKRPPMPFSDTRLLSSLSHTFWFLPSVASCHAMRNLLRQRQNQFYDEYKIIVAAGPDAGIGTAALKLVKKGMSNPLKSRTITLSCGKLTTGVTVRPWSAIFMLRNLNSPETYFQAAFRIQSPWTVDIDPSSKKYEIIKKECYIFDFAPNRALKQIGEYGCRLNPSENNCEEKVREFIDLLPVLIFEGSCMMPIEASGVLEFAKIGTTATLLARRWKSTSLINLDNNTLARLFSDKVAMRALMNIEGFKHISGDIELIINKSNTIKAKKRSIGSGKLSKSEKEQLSDDEKEYRDKLKQIKEKFCKLIARIPIFMYLTDFREYCLKDIITQLEPDLFKKVTGLNIIDFERFISLGLFNSTVNNAIYDFKRYEDSSLSYTGISRCKNKSIRLYNKSITIEEFKNGPSS